MPRTNRENISSEYIHLITQGICKENIFQEEKYKKYYLKTINRIFKEYTEIKLLAHCIMDNHAHFLLYTDNIKNVSNSMKRINTIYAMYYNKEKNRVGYVFRDRYYTQAVLSTRQLYNTIAYIHKNPVKARIATKMEEYPYSSYNKFKNKKIDIEIPILIFKTKDYLKIFNYIHKNFSDDGIYDIKEERQNNEEFTIIKLNQIIDDFCMKNNISLKMLQKNDKLILKLVNEIKEMLNIPENKIAQAIGIGKNRITNIKKKLKE